MKRRHIIGLFVILGFLFFIMSSFRIALTPYVNFAQAKTAAGNVQVRGVLGAEQISVADNGRTVKFSLKDETGEEVPVVYRGVKPDGFEQAASLVAVGKYRDGQFFADKLLVKCPSKYQGGMKKQ